MSACFAGRACGVRIAQGCPVARRPRSPARSHVDARQIADFDQDAIGSASAREPSVGTRAFSSRRKVRSAGLSRSICPSSISSLKKGMDRHVRVKSNFTEHRYVTEKNVCRSWSAPNKSRPSCFHNWLGRPTSRNNRGNNPISRRRTDERGPRDRPRSPRSRIPSADHVSQQTHIDEMNLSSPIKREGLNLHAC
jgi:hypothetical protein